MTTTTKERAVYSVKNLFRQEPSAITTVVVGWITVLVVTGVITVSAETIAAVEGAILATLLLFYVRQSSVSKDQAKVDIESAVERRESEIQTFLASSAPGPSERPLRADRDT